MRSLKLFPIAAAICFVVPAVFAQLNPWSIEIANKPETLRCGNKTINVPAANSCPAAIAAARKIFDSIIDCAGFCRARPATSPGTPVCRIRSMGLGRSASQTFEVLIPYTCAKESFGDGETGCDEAVEMKNGEPVIPPGEENEAPVDVDEDRGFLSSLYPGLDTTTDGFYPLPCEPSLGGDLPREVDEPPTRDEIEAETFVNNFEQSEGPKIVDEVNLSNRVVKIPDIADFNKGPCAIFVFTHHDTGIPVPCDDPKFLSSNQPFEGRDIIYVHGFARNHLTRWILGDKPAHRLWPKEPGEFLEPNGYFRRYAEDYWRDHIHEHLFDPDNRSNPNAGWQWTATDARPRYYPKSNRYLLVAWSSNQTLKYAQHALLEQIRLAIATNKNVVTPPSYDTTQKRPFCSNGCIIISHSTGALVVSTAMSLAKKGEFGPGGAQIPGYIRTHVAFEGAISGSRNATVFMSIGLAAGSPVPNALCSLFNEVFDLTGKCIRNTAFVRNSILRDLIPIVAQGVWGKILAKSPVPTLTVAGGHPVGNYLNGLTKLFLPGLDDGVVSMNSACGNPNPVFPRKLAPSGITVAIGVKAFEMSKDSRMLARAVKNFISHRHLMRGLTPSTLIPGFPYLAGACTPYRSPTGMVMPVMFAHTGTPWSTRARYPNHYSFIQGSIDHSYDGGSDDNNKWPSALGEPARTRRHYLQSFGPNIEETSAVTDANIYQRFADGTYLVHPSFGGLTREVVRGKKLPFTKKRPKWIWKRTFHLLDKWQDKQSSHYVYEFVGRR